MTSASLFSATDVVTGSSTACLDLLQDPQASLAQGYCLGASPRVKTKGQTRDQPSVVFISANNSATDLSVDPLSSSPWLVGRVNNRCWMLQEDAEFK